MTIKEKIYQIKFWYQTNKRLLKTHLFYILVIISAVSWIFTAVEGQKVYSRYLELEVMAAEAKEEIKIPEPKTGNEIEDYIILKAREAGISEIKALSIANCESSINPKQTNAHSTAKGVYQFINQTWKMYCKGDVFNYKDNVNCFIKLYPNHESWWDCSNYI